MPNIALQLEYNGSNFFGFQKQRFGRTIQGELEKSLSEFANHQIEIITAGRTDTGVHALNQVVNFTTSAKRELRGWVRGVNALLPDDIAIKDAVIVSDDFNARFDAVSRTYYYYLYCSPNRLGVMNKQVGWCYQNLDINKMRKACELLVGLHDFSSFRASDCQANTPIRNMLSCTLSLRSGNLCFDTMPNESVISSMGHMLCFEFTANAFLYHMVRNIVGAIIYVGKGVLSIDRFREILLANDRKLAPPTFMPDGLYLARVTYPNSLFK